MTCSKSSVMLTVLDAVTGYHNNLNDVARLMWDSYVFEKVGEKTKHLCFSIIIIKHYINSNIITLIILF
jgi:hypothetical protein